MMTSGTDLPPVSAADSEPASAATPTPGLTAHLPEPARDRRWRLLDRLIVVVFCLGLLVPGALLAIGRRSAEIENRPLHQPPAFSVGGLFDPAWYTKIDRAVTDNDAIRPYAVRLRGEAYWRLGGTGNPAVVKGRGDWLFSREEISPVCDRSAADTIADLDRIRAEFQAAGQDFRYVQAPDKHAIYPEQLGPDMPYPQACTDARRSELSAALDSRNAWVVNGWAELGRERAANPGGPLLFYLQDSHWTPTGALPAIRALVRSLGPDLWRDEDVVSGPRRQSVMDLARQIGLSRRENVPAPAIRPSVQITRTEVALPFKTRGAPAVYEITASGDRPLLPGRTVVVYDSFFGIQMAAIAPFFADSIWIHRDDLLRHPEIARLVGRADRVIFERIERGLYTTKVLSLLQPLVAP